MASLNKQFQVRVDVESWLKGLGLAHYAKAERLRVSGDETNDTPITIEDRQKIQEKLFHKLAEIADRAGNLEGWRQTGVTKFLHYVSSKNSIIG